MNRGAALALAAVAVGAALVLSACAWQPGGHATPTPSPTPTIATTPITDLVAGDCYDAVEASSAEAIDCGMPHKYEVFASFVLTDDAYPGDAMKSSSAQRCRTAFSAFVGVEYDSSALNLRFIAPSKATWAIGDREVLCVVFDPHGDTTGSLAESAR